MNYCRKCNKEISDEAVFCEYCGARQRRKTDKEIKMRKNGEIVLPKSLSILRVCTTIFFVLFLAALCLSPVWCDRLYVHYSYNIIAIIFLAGISIAALNIPILYKGKEKVFLALFVCSLVLGAAVTEANKYSLNNQYDYYRAHLYYESLGFMIVVSFMYLVSAVMLLIYALKLLNFKKSNPELYKSSDEIEMPTAFRKLRTAMNILFAVLFAAACAGGIVYIYEEGLCCFEHSFSAVFTAVFSMMAAVIFPCLINISSMYKKSAKLFFVIAGVLSLEMIVCLSTMFDYYITSVILVFGLLSVTVAITVLSLIYGIKLLMFNLERRLLANYGASEGALTHTENADEETNLRLIEPIREKTNLQIKHDWDE